MENSLANKRLKEILNDLPDSITDIAVNTGISRNTIYDVIRNGRSINHKYLVRLWERYNIDIMYILTGHKSESRLKGSQEDFNLIPCWGSDKKSKIALSESWVKNQLHMKWSDLYTFGMAGHSMAPAYKNGDDLVVSISRQEPRPGPAFLIEIDNKPYIKLLELLPDGSLKVYTHNPRFEPFEIGKDDFSRYKVIGEVICSVSITEYL